MKQPELGQKLIDLRKEKNLTQEELVDACNVSVRTIQRIESGEVTPRTSTIKILLAALGEDFDSFRSDLRSDQSNEDLSSLENWLTAAWIAGIMYFILGFIDGVFEYERFEAMDFDTSPLLYISIKILYLGSYIIFLVGLIRLALYFDNYLFRITAYLMIAVFSLSTAFDIITLYYTVSDYNMIFFGAGESMSVGAIGIVMGVSLMRLQDGMGTVAKMAGIMEVIVGVFFLTVLLFLLGYIMMVPAIVLEIILLFKAADFIRSERLQQ